MIRPFSIIVALDQKQGIGLNGQLPWQLPADLKHFKDITCQVEAPAKQNAVIMGRVTWESLPLKFRPLPGRLNVVMTRHSRLELPGGVLKVGSFEDALKAMSRKPYLDEIDHIFVIGGGQVFSEAIAHPQCSRLYITHIHHDYSCDTFFPPIPLLFREAGRSEDLVHNSIPFHFSVYSRT